MTIGGTILILRSVSCQVRISYLEIYNDHGYDLLDPNHETKKLEDLPKVRACCDVLTPTLLV